MEDSIKNVIELNSDYEKLSKFEHVLESRLASYNVTASFQLVMKKDHSINSSEHHQLQPLSRKTSALSHPTPPVAAIGRVACTGSLNMAAAAADQPKAAVFHSLYYVMSKCGEKIEKERKRRKKNSISFHDYIITSRKYARCLS